MSSVSISSGRGTASSSKKPISTSSKSQDNHNDDYYDDDDIDLLDDEDNEDKDDNQKNVSDDEVESVPNEFKNQGDDDFVDYPWLKDIPKNLVSEDEMEEIFVTAVKRLGPVKGDLFVNKQLFFLLCCITGDSVAQTSKSDKHTYHELLATFIKNLKSNIHLKKTILDHILKYFPNHTLPDSFHDYFKEMASKSATTTYSDGMKM